MKNILVYCSVSDIIMSDYFRAPLKFIFYLLFRANITDNGSELENFKLTPYTTSRY